MPKLSTRVLNPHFRRGVKWCPENNFWPYVLKSEEGCWEWQGALSRTGYGLTHPAKGKSHNTSRVAWVLTFGAVPAGLLVCHTCDNRKCCRPDHLFLGTPKDNIQDALRKKRIPSGEDNYLAKLTDDAVRTIRSERLRGVSCGALAARFGVSHKAIRLAADRTTWRHVV